MKAIEARTVIEEGLDRMRSLDANQQPAFGVMSADDMVRHLIGSLELTFYEDPIELEIPEDKVPKAYAFLHSDHLIRPGANQPAFYHELSAPADQEEFDRWVEKLRFQYDRMATHLDTAPNDWSHAHPKFGTLDKEMWWLFQGKHFYHNMSQFGLFPRLEVWEGIPE